jgi:hypothetical protein
VQKEGSRMTQSSIRQLLTVTVVTLGVLATVSYAKFAFAADSPTTQPSDFSRLIGTWQATLMNGDTPIFLTWINREDGYTTTTPEANGPVIAGSGTLQAQDGVWQTTTFDGEGDQGVYHFMHPNTVVFEGEAGIAVVWTRKPAPGQTTAKIFSGRPKVAGLADQYKSFN